MGVSSLTKKENNFQNTKAHVFFFSFLLKETNLLFLTTLVPSMKMWLL